MQSWALAAVPSSPDKLARQRTLGLRRGLVRRRPRLAPLQRGQSGLPAATRGGHKPPLPTAPEVEPASSGPGTAGSGPPSPNPSRPAGTGLGGGRAADAKGWKWADLHC